MSDTTAAGLINDSFKNETTRLLYMYKNYILHF